MLQKRPLTILILMLALSALACNAFAGNVEPAPVLELPETPDTGVPPTAIADFAPTATLPGGDDGPAATLTPIPTSSDPQLTILVDLNIRTGPGVIYDRVGFFFGGSSTGVIGRDPASGWWKIPCPADVAAPECWVSGGTQYTRAVNADSIPVAPVPPTPTPRPTATPTATPPVIGENSVVGSNLIADNGSRIVYTTAGGLWLRAINRAAGTISDPEQLSAAPDISTVRFSPDGAWVAYLRGEGAAYSMHLIDLATGAERLLVTTADIPIGTREPLLALIDQITWLPDSSGLLFNSVLVNPEGPGRSAQSDLRQVTRDGTITEIFPNGSAGHSFTLSPDGTQLLFSDPETIKRADLGEGSLETVITFDFVNTASESPYVPTVQWAGDGRAAYTAISSPDPWSEPPTATLYRIPRTGAAVELGVIDGNILFNPVLWTPAGDQLAHVRFFPGENRAELQLGAADGAELRAVSAAASLRTFAWDDDGTQLLFAGPDYFGVAGAAADPVLTAAAAVDLRWLDDAQFLAITTTGTGWQITLHTLDGAATPLFTSDAPFVQWDVRP